MKNILVVGSSNTDMIIRVPRPGAQPSAPTRAEIETFRTARGLTE